jgi:hypothetical protein
MVFDLSMFLFVELMGLHQVVFGEMIASNRFCQEPEFNDKASIQ